MSLCFNLFLLVINIHFSFVAASECIGCKSPDRGVEIGGSERDEEFQLPNHQYHHNPLYAESNSLDVGVGAANGALSPAPTISENANNRSIYSSLTKIIYQLKNQLKHKDTSNGVDRPTTRTEVDNETSESLMNSSQQQVGIEEEQTNRTGHTSNGTSNADQTLGNDNKNTTVTVEISSEPQDATKQQQQSSAPATTMSPTEIQDLEMPSQSVTRKLKISSTHKPVTPKRIVLSNWRPATQSPIDLLTSRRRTPERSSRNNRKLDDHYAYYNNRANGVIDQLLSDNGARQRAKQTNHEATSWSRPLPFVASNSINLDDARQSTAAEESFEQDRVAAASNEHPGASYRRPTGLRMIPLIEAPSSESNDYFASNSDLQALQPDDEDRAQFASTSPSDQNAVDSGRTRSPINPQTIRLQQVYPNAPYRIATISLANGSQQQARSTKIYAPNHNAGNEMRVTGARPSAPLASYIPDLGASNDNLQQHSVVPAQTDGHQLRLHQRQSLPPYRDLMDQPQTIQITAIPNNNVLANGILGGLGGGNQIVRINANGQLGNMWNNGLLDPFNRPIMMVNAERRQLDWSFWIWPLIAIVTLPLIMSALFVPIFLKTIIIIIQILQSLGLLLPIANALGQQIAHATGTTAASAALGSLASSNQLAVEHHQKDDLANVRNVTTATTRI